MLRCVIALFLINIYYPSNGLPLQKNATNMSLADQLQNLANICENSVLSELIKRQIEHCNVSDTSTDTKTKFKCLMFYDINTQLCGAFRRSKFNLQENYTTKMNEIQDIKIICNHAKTWKFTYKDKYPQNESIDQVFKNDIYCIQMCSVDGFVSSDSNFFCKYYQWGSELIQSQTPTMTPNSGVAAPVLAESILNPLEIKNDTFNTPRNENATVSISENIIKPMETKLPVLPKSEASKEEISNIDLSGMTSTANQTSTANSVQIPLKTDDAHKITEQSVVLNLPTLSKNEIEKQPVEETPPKKDKVEKGVNIQKDEPKESVIDNPKLRQPVGDIDDDQEDENDEDTEYVQGSDQDDALRPMESEPNIDVKKSKNSLSALEQNGINVPLLDMDQNIDVQSHKNRVGIESITSVSETFPNPMQDTFSDDDDHFFPFFLTAIIIVVLLYVLYHNKNKFTKVILGLLVEGRQTGRRRNSRGHAYRRLDTLEQAMNTNTAAPPSKIIY